MKSGRGPTGCGKLGSGRLSMKHRLGMGWVGWLLVPGVLLVRDGQYPSLGYALFALELAQARARFT